MGEIGGKGDRFSALSLDFRHKVQGIGGGGAIMDAHAPAVIRQIESNSPAEPASRAGHQHGPRILDLSHAVLLGAVRRIESQSEFLRAESYSRRAPKPE